MSSILDSEVVFKIEYQKLEDDYLQKTIWGEKEAKRYFPQIIKKFENVLSL